MKKYKSIIAVMLALAIIFAFAACKKDVEDVDDSVTEIVEVTDESGEPVTDENGEAVTEVETVSQKSEGKNGSDKKENKKKSDTASKEKATISKPSKPKGVSGLKAEKVKTDSLVLKWNGVECTAYHISYKEDGGAWEYLEKSYSKTSYTVEGLKSATNYTFRVRSYNENTAGISASKWNEIKVKTAENKTPRKINITVLLPADSNIEDELTLFIDDEEVKTDTVRCNGSEYTFETKDKYEGEVEIRAELKNEDVQGIIKTDKDECYIDISVTGTYEMFDGEE